MYLKIFQNNNHFCAFIKEILEAQVVFQTIILVTSKLPPVNDRTCQKV